ncbi:hypothetical protein [Clostridium sp. YIM B02551]|nr:hypothetical protein [Clostridium sp. YIM B02551]
MKKDIKLVSCVIMQALVLLTLFILVILSLKYNFSVEKPMLLLLFPQLVI